MTTILYPEADQYKNNNVNLKFFAHKHTHTHTQIWIFGQTIHMFGMPKTVTFHFFHLETKCLLYLNLVYVSYDLFNR